MQIWARVIFVAVHLVEFYGPDNQLVEVNPDTVVSIRTPRGKEAEHFHESVGCLIFTSDAKFTAVREDCKTVEQRLQEAR
jgi:hypothetical protein